MNDDEVLPRARPGSGHAWFREGGMPHSREDRVAEALALFALLFSIGIGLVIALLPTSAPAAAPSSARPAWRTSAPRSSPPQRLAAAGFDDATAPGRCIEGTAPRPCVRGR